MMATKTKAYVNQQRVKNGCFIESVNAALI